MVMLHINERMVIDVFEGEFENDSINLYRILKCSNGDVFEGEF
jgi:hypothetical protein